MSDLDAERDLRIAQLLDDAMTEWRARGLLDEAAWQARYPDLADEIPGLFDTLRDLDTAAGDWKLADPVAAARTVAEAPPPEPPTAERLPARVGRYRILGQLGRGGMGTVYKAEDPQLNRVVAVKIPRLDTPSLDRPQAVQRFLREARAAARIRHPHVCPIYDVGEEDGWPYVVMAFVEGPSLADRLLAGRFDDARAAAALAARAADALAAVHASGVVHRDLKPGNILLDAEARPILTDFGLAYPADDGARLTVSGALVGTPAYMAPEQAAGDQARIGPASDIYSLGVVLYQMLTGRLPFEGSTMSVLARLLSETPPPPSQLRPDLDPALEAVILRAMARRPEDRFPDARTFADALRRWSEGKPAPDAPPAARKEPGPAVVRVALPDGSPVSVSVDPGAGTPKKVDVSVREGRRAKGKRRRLAVTVTITFALLIGLGAVAAGPFLAWLDQQRSGGSPPGSVAMGPPWAYEPVRDKAPDLPANPLPPDLPLTKVRTPRVHIGYDVETGGAMVTRELPFVVGVLADLSGSPAAPARALKDRQFRRIDRDNFDDVLKQIAPRLALEVPNRLGGDGPMLKVDIAFESRSDFEPAAVARKVPALQALLDSRKTATPEEVAAIDAKLSAQVNEILHHPDYQRLEAAWRGLDYLVVSTETSESLIIRVLDVSKRELAQDADAAADFDRTVLYNKVFEEEFGQLGGEPYGVLVGDYDFGRDAEDVRLLQSIADVAAYAHAPFVAGASPQLFGVAHLSDLASARDLAGRFTGNEYEAWRAFRASDSSRYVGLTLPRVLARLPYGKDTKPADDFDFEESVSGEGRSSFLWMNAAWAFAVRVTDAYAKYGWPARIHGWEGGGKVEDLPYYDFPAGGEELPLRSFTEVSVWGRREGELSDLGLLPLLHVSGQEAPAFMGSPSCHRPNPADDDAGQVDEEASQLEVLLCTSRFVQCLQVMARDKIGAFKEREDVVRWLNEWVGHYVLSDPEKAEEAEQAKRPLAFGKVEVRELRGKPAWYELVVQIRPCYQLDAPVPLRLTAEIPMNK